jgi:hypothetical protein
MSLKTRQDDDYGWSESYYRIKYPGLNLYGRVAVAEGGPAVFYYRLNRFTAEL